MRLSRTDLVPVLAIVAGGVIGASLSISFLGRSPAVDADAARRTLEAVVLFDYDEATITAASERLLRAKLPILRNSPTVRLRLEGHADERGSTEYNLARGNRRAKSVEEFLSRFGISADRITLNADRPQR